MPGPHRPLRERAIYFWRLLACRTQKLHRGEDSESAPYSSLISAALSRVVPRFIFPLCVLVSSRSRRVSPMSPSLGNDPIPGGRFPLQRRFLHFATTYQGAAPYFFTFHTSHSLWEVRKHGTVARWLANQIARLPFARSLFFRHAGSSFAPRLRNPL